MTPPEAQNPDFTLERFVGRLLQIGVLIAAAVVVVGGMLFLIRAGTEPAGHGQFIGEPEELRSPIRIIKSALALDSRALIQFGLLLLIATPIARVILTVFAFAKQRDFTYLIVTLIVLAVLLYSLFSAYL